MAWLKSIVQSGHTHQVLGYPNVLTVQKEHMPVQQAQHPATHVLQVLWHLTADPAYAQIALLELIKMPLERLFASTVL